MPVEQQHHTFVKFATPIGQHSWYGGPETQPHKIQGPVFEYATERDQNLEHYIKMHFSNPDDWTIVEEES